MKKNIETGLMYLMVTLVTSFCIWSLVQAGTTFYTGETLTAAKLNTAFSEKVDVTRFVRYSSSHRGGDGGGGGSGYVESGTVGQVAYYESSGVTVKGLTVNASNVSSVFGADPYGTAASVLTSHTDAFIHGNIPTSGQKDALTGSYGTPSSSNKYVTNSDPRIPVGTGTNGQYLTTNGTTASWGTLTVSNLAGVTLVTRTSYDAGTLTTNASLSLSNGMVQRFILGGTGLTFTIPAANSQSGNSWTMTVVITCDSTDGRTYSWAQSGGGSIVWMGTDTGIFKSKRAIYNFFSDGATLFAVETWKEPAA